MRDPRSGWIQLSAAEFVLVWSAMRLGPIPLELGIPNIGRTTRSRAELMDEASLTLSGRDLGTVQAPARDLAHVLRQLAAAQTLLDLTVDGQESSLAAIGSITPQGSAVAARVSDEVRIGPVERVTLALLDAVVPLPAGPGSSVNIRVADYEAACTEGVYDGVSGFVRALSHAGVRQADATMVARALVDRLGGGRLGVSHGRDRSSMSWVDTAEGRYVLRDAGGWVSVVPVDPNRLSVMADEMVVSSAAMG
ncbi:MAG: ESX secretion-associated protein EspG [Kibdelosporangium sp.]